MGIDVTRPSPTQPIRENARSGSHDIGTEMFDWLAAVSGDDPDENVLHHVINFGIIGNPAAKIAGQPLPHGSRLLFQRRLTSLHDLAHRGRVSVERPPSFGPWGKVRPFAFVRRSMNTFVQ